MSRASAAQSEQMLSGTTEVILFCIFYSLMSVFRGFKCKSDENKDQSDDSTVIIRRSLLASSHLLFLFFTFPSEHVLKVVVWVKHYKVLQS